MENNTIIQETAVELGCFKDHGLEMSLVDMQNDEIAVRNGSNYWKFSC